MDKLKKSLSNINMRLFIALLVLGLCPTIYTTVRVFFLGQMPGDWSFSIAGQLSWVNLLYEVIREAIILPLFFFVGKVKEDKKAFSNHMRTGMLMTFGVFTVVSAIVFIFAKQLLSLMAADETILAASATYIRIESVANVFSILAELALVALVSVDRSRYIYILTGTRLILSLVFDTFLISTLPVSLNLGVNGIGYSNIIVNILILFISLLLLRNEGVKVFTKEPLDFGWMKDLLKIGGISGLESFVRNVAYMLMVARMVNVVGEQGTYWVANSFIWGWLLLPILQLGELIKEETAESEDNVRKNTLGYFAITFGVCVIWCLTIPLWKPFMTYILQYSDVDKLLELVLILLGFYVLFAFQNIFDATFYGLGKTNYMLFESVVTNTIYYGAAFLLYITGKWTPTLIGIAMLFGFGNAFDTLVSAGAYIFMLREKKINLLKVD
ncbi:MAG: multidrug transporter [Eubacteriaceae bacterium]|nr:multidrug transporter [Eubacteriaceae bacterium]